MRKSFTYLRSSLLLFAVGLAANLLILFPANAQPKSSQAECPNRVIIAPPPVNDWQFGAWLGNEIGLALKKIPMGGCWVVIPFDKSSAAFDIVGSTTAFPRTPGSFGPRQIEYLSDTHSASHIAFPEKYGKSGKMRVKLFVINEEEKLIFDRNVFVEIDAEESTRHQSNSVTRFLSSLAPNSVQLGFTNTRVYFETVEPYIDEKIVERGVMPPIISSIGATRAEHPRAYGMFDVAGTVFPAQYFFGINQKNSYTLNPDTPESAGYPRDLSLHIETYGACGNANAQASLFTPLGTTYLGAGWGPCLLWLKTQARAPAWYGTTALRLFFGHRMFATKNLYFSVDVDTLSFNQRLFVSEYSKTDQITRAGFSMGWYVENTEKLATDFWNWIF